MKSQTRPWFAGGVILAVVGLGLTARAAFDEPLEAPLTFTGRVAGVAGDNVDLTFTFTKEGEAPCGVVADNVPLTAEGTFTTVLDTSLFCFEDFFSGGSPPVVSISVDGTEVVTNQVVGAVPFARFADAARTADTATRVSEAACPPGYTAETDDSVAQCRRGQDVVVKVGSGASSFWLDRYEAAIFDAGTQLAQGAVNNLARDGRDLILQRAESREGVTPSANITWMQANTLCRLSGKRLPRRAEWLFAARTLSDETACNLTSGQVRATGLGPCSTAEGVEDLFGNLQEYVEEWGVAPGDDVTVAVNAGIDGDRIFNQAGVVRHFDIDGDADEVDDGVGIPAVEIRGGSFVAGGQGGLFFGGADRSPLNRINLTGFRCLTPR